MEFTQIHILFCKVNKGNLCLQVKLKIQDFNNKVLQQSYRVELDGYWPNPYFKTLRIGPCTSNTSIKRKLETKFNIVWPQCLHP